MYLINNNSVQYTLYATLYCGHYRTVKIFISTFRQIRIVQMLLY